ncbi:MAG: Hsp20/alpha crystallin family protein [Cyclobacteriaceae bacterium]
MSIARYNTAMNDFLPISFGNLVERFFNESVSRSGGASYAFVPKVDIIENETAFEIHLAVPGVSKEDFKIDLKDHHLTISGERRFGTEKSENNFKLMESQYGTFRRSFALPENVDGEKINASYKDGILALVVPKDEKKLLKTTIKVA